MARNSAPQAVSDANNPSAPQVSARSPYRTDAAPSPARTVMPRIVDEISGASPQLITDILTAVPGVNSHDELARRSELFDIVEVIEPPYPPPRQDQPASVRVGAWNLERGKYIGAAAAVIADTGFDVGLLCEVDKGMARSGNRDAIRELAAQLGFGYAFCVEFIEAGAGHSAEMAEFADEPNRLGLHGNAIISRFPLENIRIIAAKPDGVWFDLDWHHRRVGGRCALLADVRVGEQAVLRVASVHFESMYTPQQRAAEARELLEAMAIGGLPDVIGGDLNTHAIPCGPGDSAWLARPQEYEPLFDVLRDYGYHWTGSNTADPTRRTLRTGWPKPPHTRCDWLLCRSGLSVAVPTVIPALNSAGFPISDHDMVIADIVGHGPTVQAGVGEGS